MGGGTDKDLILLGQKTTFDSRGVCIIIIFVKAIIFQIDP